MDTLYRIYTEDKNLDGIINLLTKVYDGYTIIHSQGYWKGLPEESIIIEIITYAVDLPTIQGIANQIKQLNSQESVLVTSQPVYSELI